MAQADVEATVAEPPPKKARVSREHEDKYDIAVQELAKTDEAIAAIERKILDQREGSDRRSIIACLERDISVHQTRKTELAIIVADIEEAWGEIASGFDWSASLAECVLDLDKLLPNASPE